MHNHCPSISDSHANRARSGGTIIVGGSVSLTLALTWGGIQFAWSSVQSLAPLIIGIVALIVFIVVERYWVKYPIVSVVILHDHSNRGFDFVLVDSLVGRE